MAAAYTKEFLVDAFVSRYLPMGLDTCLKLAEMAHTFYDRVGKDTFREYCTLDAAALKKFKLESQY